MERHPTTAHWTFPPERPPLPAPLSRTNLRELEARPDRFEHHLMVVARLGVAQLEVATASEPLYFAHRNISDEYALPMSCGDPMAEMVPFRTFISDFDHGRDLARINHGVDQMVLHPYGFLHWPGRLRPPFAPMPFGPGMRRTGYSLVFCASRPTPPSPARPLFVSAGREAGPKAYTGVPVPFLLADLRAEQPRTIAVVGDVRLSLLVAPGRVAPDRGGYLVVLAGGEPFFPGDLVYLPPGAGLDGTGIERALLLSSPTAAPEPPPVTWTEAPPAPFPVYEHEAPDDLPAGVAGMTLEALSDTEAEVSLGDARATVPRYWLARMLFRIALHDYAVGYLETYGGFFYDDTGGLFRLGLRGGSAVTLERAEMVAAIERLYRAVAPAGYVERLT
jgi:hypothetical protein